MARSEWLPKPAEFKPNWLSPAAFRQAIVRCVYIFCFAVVIIGAIGGILILFDIYVVFPNQIKITNLASVVGPLILSTLLAYLYYQQKQILSKDHQSNISVNRFIDAEENIIKLKLSNSGSGAVQRVFLHVQLDFDDGNLEGKENYLGLQKAEESTSRSFLKPHETDSIFEKKFLLPIQFPDEADYRIIPFGMGMRFAEQHGATSGHLAIDLVWEDAIRTGRIRIFDEDFELNNVENFEGFMSNYPEKSAVLFGGLD